MVYTHKKVQEIKIWSLKKNKNNSISSSTNTHVVMTKMWKAGHG